MIKNAVFDIGRVLLYYEPEKYLRSLGYINETLDLAMERIFLNRLWEDMDRGAYETFEELILAIVKQYPDYEKDTRRILQKGWSRIISPIAESVDFFYELKSLGYNIYLLSNFSKPGFAYAEEAYGFLREVDGKVISYETGFLKPEESIYRELLDRYGLVPDETVFFDDLRVNTDGAAKLGIHGIVYNNAPEARDMFFKVAG